MEHFFFFILLYLQPEGSRLEAAVQGVMSRQQFSLLRLRRRSPAMSCGVGRGASSDYFWAVFLPLGDLPYYAVMQYACQDALYGGAAKGHKQLSLQVVQEVESLLGQFFFEDHC